MMILVCAISPQEPPGDILLFLTGQDDIDAAVQLLNDQNNGKHSSGTHPGQNFIFVKPNGKKLSYFAHNYACQSDTSMWLIHLTFFVPGLIILPLYSGLPRADQVRNTFVDLVVKRLFVYLSKFKFLYVVTFFTFSQELVFSTIPRGKRKVVISTNIAETSLTLEVTSKSDYSQSRGNKELLIHPYFSNCAGHCLCC